MRLSLALLLMPLVCLPAAAHASFPGTNGPLVVSVDGCGIDHRYLATVPWKGGPLTPITPQCQYADENGKTDLDVWAPDAAPDGRSVLAMQQETPYSPQSGPCACSFALVPADGAERRRLPLPPEVRYAEDPTFSPRGDRFAFRGYAPDDPAGSDIWGTRIDGSRTGEISGRDAFLHPRWSPNGKLIAVLAQPPHRSSLRSGIWLIRASDGSVVRRVTKDGWWFDWSPDGRKLVYSTRHSRSGGRATGGNLYVVSRNGGKPRPLVDRDAIAETDPTWSPDGRWIAWVSMRYEGGGDVYWKIHATLQRVRARGGRPQRIATLPTPDVDEGEFNAPGLTWLARR